MKYLISLYFENEKKFIFFKKPYKSLLEAFENNFITLEFNCRSGYCGICRLKLISGSVKYTNDPIAYVGHKEVLICSCIPTENLLLSSLFY